MQYKGLYENVKEYFERDPLPQQGRGAVKVPEWTFPGNLRVERLLRTAERAVDVADKVVTHLPKSKRMRDLVARVDRDKGRVDFVRRYSDLYGAYTEAEVIYTDDRTLELWGWVDGGRPEDGSRSTRRRSTGGTTSRTCTARR